MTALASTMTSIFRMRELHRDRLANRSHAAYEFRSEGEALPDCPEIETRGPPEQPV